MMSGGHFLLIIGITMVMLSTAGGAVEDRTAEEDTEAGVSANDGKVRVLSLQRGVWAAPSVKVFLRYDFPRNGPSVPNLSVCYRLRLERFVDYNIHLSYATSDKKANALLFYNMATELLAFVNNLQQVLTTSSTLEIFPETWNHFCHILTQDQHIVYWQGERYGSGAVGGPVKYLLNGTLILGQEQDALGGDFAASQVLQGDISQLSFWDRALSDSEVKDLVNCFNIGRGNIFSLDTAQVQLEGDIVSTFMDLQEVCQSSPHYLLLPEPRTVSASLVQCQLLNASMTVPSSDSENKNLRKILIPFMDTCGSTPWKLWLGVTDEVEEGVWVNINEGERVEYHNFVSPFPYGGSVENCASLFPDGTWGDAKCDLKKCSSCQLDPSGYLYLRGLCFENEHQTRFRVHGYVGGRPLFRGFYDLLIMWDPENAQWLLSNTKNFTLASMSPSNLEEYPLGQRIWTVQSLTCGKHAGASLTLSFSPCTAHHFMCQSGECIAHHHRCDLRFDCTDGSDEDDCSVVVLHDGYRRHVPPPGPNNSPLLLKPGFTLTRFSSVDNVNMVFTVEFQVRLTWVDDRLSFSHLKSSKGGAVLTKDDIERIWIPQYRLLNVEGGHMQLLEETVQVATAQGPKLPDLNTIKMDLVYPGADNELTVTQDYTATFACPFEFFAYPLDIQVCYINIRLPSKYEGFVRMSPDMAKVRFTGLQDLALYSVQNVRLGVESGDLLLSVEFELHCYGGSMILSLFVPSVFIFILSWGTLFVPLDALIARVVTSISALIIFYILRFTVVSSVPATMAIKLIDMWFFFIASILFTNALIHIFARDEPRSINYGSRTKPLFMRPAGGAIVITPESSPSPHAKLVAMYRTIIVPSIFIIFNIIFWPILFIMR